MCQTSSVWHLITGEYPPQIGGVADYTQLVAHALADGGDDVHVWAPTRDGADAAVEGRVTVHGLPGHFGARALVQLSRGMQKLPSGRIVVQYVPNAFGWHAINLPFCLWLLAQRDRSISVIFHEVAYGFSARGPVRDNVRGLMQRIMALCASRAAEHVFVTIPAWERLLRPMMTAERPIHWLPVPSNVAVVDEPSQIARTRALFATQGSIVVGHIGSYGADIVSLLKPSLLSLLRRHSNVSALLLGQFGTGFAQQLRGRYPDIAPRVHAPGHLCARSLSLHVSACDFLLQPFVDGVTTRRGTLMTGLAHGRAVITTIGALTESLWSGSPAVLTAPATDLDQFIALAMQLVSDRNLRACVGLAGAKLYESNFTLGHTITRLRSVVNGPCPVPAESRTA